MFVFVFVCFVLMLVMNQHRRSSRMRPNDCAARQKKLLKKSHSVPSYVISQSVRTLKCGHICRVFFFCYVVTARTPTGMCPVFKHSKL